MGRGEKKERRIRYLALVLLLCVGLFAGCVKKENNPQVEQQSGGAALVPYGDLESEPPLVSLSEEDQATAEHITSTQIDFSFRLASKLLEGVEEGENLLFSPYSIWLPLAALLHDEGLSWEEQLNLRSALGAGGQSMEAFHMAAGWMMSELYQIDKRQDGIESPLQIANALFLQKDLVPRETFLESFQTTYHGQIFGVDFSDARAPEQINQWASEHTKGLIQDVVQAFPPQTVMSLANAVYYADKWLYPFDKAETKEGVFHAKSGDVSAQFMQREDDYFLYYENTAFQSVRMPLNFGSFTVLLPKDGDANQLLRSMDWETYLIEIRDQMAARGYCSGTLVLPKFSLESGSLKLSDALEAVGVPLFGAEAISLNGITNSPEPLFLGDVVQNVKLEINEEGTTAAAVTTLDFGMGGPEPTEPFTMGCDRPFVFLLTGNCGTGEVVLFMGVVNDPGE